MTIFNIQRGFRKLGDFTFYQNAVSLQVSTSSDIFPQPSTSQHIFSSPSTSHETLPKQSPTSIPTLFSFMFTSRQAPKESAQKE